MFFCISGAEANEALIKVARRFGEINPSSSGVARKEIISFNGSFHEEQQEVWLPWAKKYAQDLVPNGRI